MALLNNPSSSHSSQEEGWGVGSKARHLVGLFCALASQQGNEYNKIRFVIYCPTQNPFVTQPKAGHFK